MTRLLSAEEFEEFESGQSRDDFNSSYPVGDEVVIEALKRLSSAILSSPEARLFPDLCTFGFFVRENNMRKAAARNPLNLRSKGLGTVVHIAPSNIPMNFAFSMVMGLFAGNRNFVRLPSQPFPQVELLVELLEGICGSEDMAGFARRLHLFRSERDSRRLAELIADADGLVVWGGDATVGHFRSLTKKPTCRELYFPTRYSSAVLSADAIRKLSEREWEALMRNFYNDTLLVDQNACSSPSIVYWLGTDKDCAEQSEIFWSKFHEYSLVHYSTWSTSGVDKLVDFFNTVSEVGRPVELRRKSNLLWRSSDLAIASGPLRFGSFLEFFVTELPAVAKGLRPNEQTLTYFGIDPEEIFREVASSQFGSVERICPVGQALDMGLVWDGKDTTAVLSRIVEVV